MSNVSIESEQNIGVHSRDATCNWNSNYFLLKEVASFDDVNCKTDIIKKGRREEEKNKLNSI